MDTLEVTWRCPTCRYVQTDSGDFPRTCSRCGRVLSAFPALRDPHPGRCVVCGVGELYRQKDFNVRWGLAVVALGAVLAYWTWGLSLIGVVLLDLWLYRRVPWVVICYFCQAHYRGLPAVETYETFDLLKHDVYKTMREQGTAPIIVSDGPGEKVDRS